VNAWLSEALDLPVKEAWCGEVTKGAQPPPRHPGEIAFADAGMRRIAIGGDVIVAIDSQKVASQLDVISPSTTTPRRQHHRDGYRAARKWTFRQARRTHRKLGAE